MVKIFSNWTVNEIKIWSVENVGVGKKKDKEKKNIIYYIWKLSEHLLDIFMFCFCYKTSMSN
jgi:hypothetical protein